MIIEDFAYDRKHFFVEFVNHTKFLFYIRNYNQCWGDEDSSEVTNNTKNPIKLLRKIDKIIRNYIYSNNLKYFSFSTWGHKRARIYKRFADSLVGYSYNVMENEYGAEFFFNKD